MRRAPLALVLLLALTLGSPALAQGATPVATPAAEPVNLAGVAPLPLTGERRAAFESYIADAMQRFAVPGAAVAVVQNGAVVYAQGFGVTRSGGSEPVTADTLFMIGSVTKSMTSMLAATLVDDGWLSWQTPIVQELPDFAVADPTLTKRLTVADAFCACTGVPARDADLIFNIYDLTPKRVIAQVADLPLTAPLGERYQYSNQMYAIGGYAAARAAGADPDHLNADYEAALRERILNPIGMTRSTFALDDVLASGDYALPHAQNLEGETRPFPLLVDENFVSSVTPAGGLWSSARDMARYLQTELADGVAPDGTRVVSVESLAQTWQPRVAVPVTPGLPPVVTEGFQHYGMGWIVGAYHGQPLISHSGGTFGFASEVAFLPEANLGIVILSNGGAGGAPALFGIQYHLFSLLFDQPAEVDAFLDQAVPARDEQLAALRAMLRPVDPAAVTPYLGRYTNPALGEVVLRLQDGTLILDSGEIRSELRAVVGEDGQIEGYIFVDPPLNRPDVPVFLQEGAEGGPELSVTVPDDDPTIPPVTYVFTAATSSASATPVP
ncbi:MAG: serine hydrolase domain-containing protein [Thermomicrobiales bacterium]